MSTAATTHAPDDHAHAHDDHHYNPGFWQKWVFSTEHKMNGLQYGTTGLAFLMFGFMLMMVMRWQLAHPGEAVPVIGGLLQPIQRDSDTKTPNRRSNCAACPCR